MASETVSDIEDAVARAMWTAAYTNPTLPVPLPFDQLAGSHRDQLLAMARAAITILTT